MPKRKATTKLSGLVGSDDEDVMQVNGTDSGPDPDTERPAKRARGRPAAKATESKLPPPMKTRSGNSTVQTQAHEVPAKKKRGRPKGSGGRSSTDGAEQVSEKEEPKQTKRQNSKSQERDDEAGSDDDLQVAQDNAPKATKNAKDVKLTNGRDREKASSNAEKLIKSDGEFQYTPTPRKTKSLDKPKQRTESPVKQEMEVDEADETVPESQKTAADVVDETIIEEPAPRRSLSPTKSMFHRSSIPRFSLSPQKRRLEDGKTSTEPELRRKIGDLTKKCDTLENRYRNLREIGIVEANSNMEKLRKQCDAMTIASNDLISSLKQELEAQRALGQQSRALQKQLKDRDAEVAQFKSQAEEATSQLAAAQSEVKALQTKLSAARNTAASLESAVVKVPGSAIKGGANRANAAASAEAAHAAQYAQLKEDLYSDLTGLIIRDVKRREADSLYDCIQTGSNGTLHFKLTVPHVSSANFESAEFQYIPLLDENRDRDLVAILPEYLTVDITFSRQQASKFYTRVIDTLTKRRNSSSASASG
ncbi:putative chromosome segregation protein (Pcs1) [Aspergillus chevalieri]|uniref:Monopolin complex subunit Csm1/Pcs1 C-terminal domain-containing protein n=1 Tax=Aspergillus chevalieri TaxID=182096 RepID=A0A7R7ZMZ7_ASPCH|nr:uncharacterized protein ACHE_31126S [Aspergillus chevalieri]BCR87139.1 hypothetical protein ACHE_31126S [Aspergillus chevalieri]